MAAPKYHSLQIIPDDLDIVNPDTGKFNGVHTWNNWYLIPLTRPVINPPPFKANFVSIPGGNSSIDASTVLTKYPVYDDRTGSIEFYVTREYDRYAGWIEMYHKVLNYLHGELFKVVLDDDLDYYYRGRLAVNQWKSEKDWSKIVLDYHFEPFKIYRFPDDTYYQNIDIHGQGFTTPAFSIEFDLRDWNMPVCPEITILPKAYDNGSNPSEQTPACISFVQKRKGKTVATHQYRYTDILVHAQKPYDMVFRNEKSMVNIYADTGSNFTVSFNFMRGKL